MWLYRGNIIEEIEPHYAAFVYIITNNISGKKYIGLKQTRFAKTKQVKGKKKKYFVESDWRDYWSSSDDLKNDVQLLGKENFTREILYLCALKSHANYLEAREQMDRRVLENPDLYYNRIVNMRVSHNHIKKLLSETV